jgi:hypothetical protein
MNRLEGIFDLQSLVMACLMNWALGIVLTNCGDKRLIKYPVHPCYFPTIKMWEQVAQQQKPKTNPWFQSSKIKPVENEAHSANTRTMDGLLQYSKNGSLTVAGGDGDDGKCDQKQAEYKARKEEYDSYENAITTLDGAIEDLENDIEDYKGKDPSFFDYECRKKVREFIKLVELYDIFFGKGKAVSKLLKLKLEWLTVMACSDSKAAERKRQFIEDMESALDGLISTRDDIEDALPDKETEVNDALDGACPISCVSDHHVNSNLEVPNDGYQERITR